jgi:hypothetical protein
MCIETGQVTIFLIPNLLIINSNKYGLIFTDYRVIINTNHANASRHAGKIK